MTKKNKNISVTLRITEDEYAPFKDVIEKLGTNRSEFFRAVILNNFNPEIHDRKTKTDIQKLLFYFNKASNNINQLAKQVNTQAKINGIDERKLIQFYSKLNRIYDSFENGLNQAKRSAKNQE